ncbi:MAG: ATP-binding protein [Propionibacteriaceae bacterium]|nr:ATP-binding protein [Propionibacteriaceae bacterium]
MERLFNTAGPVDQSYHYCVPPLSRVDWTEIQELIERNSYFILHAPRQTGKTTTLFAMREALNEAGRYASVYANIEVAQTARDDVARGITAAADAVADRIDDTWPGLELRPWFLSEGRSEPPERQFESLLARWTRLSDKPTVLFLDEVDALVGDTLISLLRQLRSGYNQRPGGFPTSVVLCGVRDVKDYRIRRGDGEIITGGSAFNIKTDSLRLGDFTFQEAKGLWLQHTAATGQQFDQAIWEELWADTAGQPWLVNALAHEATWRDRSKRDRTQPVTLEDYKAARERLIQSRATHLDQLADKLTEPQVARVVSAVLAGDDATWASPADQEYVADLGLVKLRPSVHIANRIYQEVIPRQLTWARQVGIPNQEQSWYVAADRRLDLAGLLTGFQQFFRENDDWNPGEAYKESSAQLLFQAFLQRIVNGQGRISREYALGRKRTDLLVEWPLDPERGLHGPSQRAVIETKLRRNSLEKDLADGLEQVVGYLRRAGADEAHLIIFDRLSSKSWDEKIWRRTEMWDGVSVQVWGA